MVYSNTAAYGRNDSNKYGKSGHIFIFTSLKYLNAFQVQY